MIPFTPTPVTCPKHKLKLGNFQVRDSKPGTVGHIDLSTPFGSNNIPDAGPSCSNLTLLSCRTLTGCESYIDRIRSECQPRLCPPPHLAVCTNSYEHVDLPPSISELSCFRTKQSRKCEHTSHMVLASNTYNDNHNSAWSK